MTAVNNPTPADIEALAGRYQQGTPEGDLYALLVDSVNLYLLHAPVPTDCSPLDGLIRDLRISLGWRWGQYPGG
jgi:hypothetical protein